jgi:hypothetical protein
MCWSSLPQSRMIGSHPLDTSDGDEPGLSGGIHGAGDTSQRMKTSHEKARRGTEKELVQHLFVSFCAFLWPILPADRA